MYCEMKVFGFAVDTLANRPVVILKDASDKNTIPLWLSSSEGVLMSAELLLWESTARSGRKDLMSLILAQIGIEIRSIVVEGMKDGIIEASVKFSRDGEEMSVAVRPCEAVIAALKYKMPILVAHEVLDLASGLAMTDEIAEENNARRFTDFLESLNPASLGKYPM
jgi:uncharacterized protein